MDASRPTAQQFPMEYPDCNASSGMPFSVKTVAHTESIKVAMRCRECFHEWHIAMQVDATRDTSQDPRNDGV